MKYERVSKSWVDPARFPLRRIPFYKKTAAVDIDSNLVGFLICRTRRTLTAEMRTRMAMAIRITVVALVIA
jgi:hypothetical protein